MQYLSHLDAILSLRNPVTGLGTEYDSLASTSFVARKNYLSLDQRLLDSMFENSWQCRKVCEYLPAQMARAWGHIEFEDLSDQKKMQSLKSFSDILKSRYLEAQTFANLYGGTFVVKYIDDGLEFDQPVNYNNIRSCSYSRVYDKWEIVPDDTAIYKNPYEPEWYKYQGLDENEQAVTKRIHKSRLARFRGAIKSPRSIQESDYYEDSVLAKFIEPYMRYNTALAYTGEAMRNFEVFIFKIAGLIESGIEENTTGFTEKVKQLYERFKVIQQQMSSQRGIAIDAAEEDVTVLNRRFQGVKDILAYLKEEMIAASGLTKPQFYQEHPDGFAATGESERLAEANDVLALCEKQWSLLMAEDLKVLSSMLALKGLASWQWDSLYAETPTERINKRKLIAETDKLYLDMGVLSPDEIRQSRFGQAEYSEETTLQQGVNQGQEMNQENQENQEQPLNTDELDTQNNKIHIPGEILLDSEYEQGLSAQELAELEDTGD